MAYPMKRRKSKKKNHREYIPAGGEPATEGQKGLIKMIARSLCMDLNGVEVSSAMTRKYSAMDFISEYKPAFDKFVAEEREERRVTSPIDEVRLGTSSDDKAKIRGEAIAKFLGLYADAEERYDTAKGKKSAAGLYRAIIGVTIEASDHLT